MPVGVLAPRRQGRLLERVNANTARLRRRTGGPVIRDEAAAAGRRDRVTADRPLGPGLAVVACRRRLSDHLLRAVVGRQPRVVQSHCAVVPVRTQRYAKHLQ